MSSGVPIWAMERGMRGEEKRRGMQMRGRREGYQERWVGYSKRCCEDERKRLRVRGGARTEVYV